MLFFFLSLASLTAFLSLGALGQEAARFGVFDTQPSTVKLNQVRKCHQLSFD
jgi:hypothetical protein